MSNAPSDERPDRLQRQLAFLLEADKLKHVKRRTWLLDQSRLENDAEHSWHLALMVLLLDEHAADADFDRLRAMQMVIIHDLVEIDAGDTYAYDAEANLDKADRERRAAERIFGMLPDDQARRFRGLWDEFEQRATPEAKFAAAVDRLQPLLHNFHTGGRAWREHQVHVGPVLERTEPIGEGSPALWRHARALIDAARDRGDLLP